MNIHNLSVQEKKTQVHPYTSNIPSIQEYMSRVLFINSKWVASYLSNVTRVKDFRDVLER